MSEPLDDGGNAGATPQPEPQDQGRTFTQADVDKLISERLARVKSTPPPDYAQFKAAAAELQKIQDRDLSELQRAQKAAIDADARAKAVTGQYGQKLARAHFDALAARRNPDVSTSDVLEYVDLSRFVGEDGEVDEKSMAAAVARLIPEPSGGNPGFDGGPRTPPPAGQDMNAIIRRAAGH